MKSPRYFLWFGLVLACAIGINAQTTVQPNAVAASTPAPAAAEKPSPSPAPAAAAKGSFVLPPEKSKPVVLPKFDEPPVIDGKLNEEVWQNAVVLKDFYQIQPGDNTPPSRPTEVLLGFDPKFLYIAFKATDEPDKVRATVAKRDNIFQDDYVGFYLDTFNDKRKAFEAFFNPLGIQGDGILTEGRGEDFSVEINILTLRGTYQFTNATFARLILDYNTLNSRLRSQALFGWTPSPGTAFYAGYNDDLNYESPHPFTRQIVPGFRRNSRTLFIKMSYLIRRGF